MTHDPLDRVQLAAILKPGDRVLLAMARDDCDQDRYQEIGSQLEDAFPGVKFAIVYGATGLAVMPEPPEPELTVHKLAHYVPLSPGTCENCAHRVAYNLAAGIAQHTDPHPADCTCTQPYPTIGG